MNTLSMPSLPMFYRGLQSLEPKRHWGFGVRGVSNFSAVAKANAVPLGISEFALAARSYPIVFGPAVSAGIPVAVTALVEGQNLFVDADGQWLPETYIPGYLRRYPFWMRVDDEGRSASFFFDPYAEKIVPLECDATARPLFDFRGQPNTALGEIVNFCRQCLQDEQMTQRFMAALERERLLVQRQAHIELAPGQYYELGGFRVVDMDAYHRLPDATLADWVRQGYAALIAVHQWSMTHNWQHLLALHQQQTSSPLTQTEPA
ncbi:SapC family protein [Comamonas odontotermitis]|uniref:SapC family protein n=1 Tax=Comamonas odontotermitis TaxID=379895 RepID=UPI001CC4FBA3|nr:SapC family protein [Comamonas odontotermitis]UBB15761.1 SapC family protein [Comamonas odontotermitis]